MVPFDNYKFAKMSTEDNNMLSEVESKISAKDNKKVVLIAYEQIDEAEK